MKNLRNSRLVHGVGTNDAGYSICAYSIIDGRRKKSWACTIYAAWTSMLERCYSEKFQVRCPTYLGCAVTDEWHSFSSFRAWMLAQDYEGNHLDKDILHPGNKVYGPDSCVFVSGQLNMFMNDHGAVRGDYPLGVSLDSKAGKLRAQCCNPFNGKREHLGFFTCSDAAHKAWRQRKHEHACAYADMQSDPRVAAALRIRYAPHG